MFNEQGSESSPPISLKEIINIIIRARYWIIALSTIVFFITAYVTYSTPPLFKSSASVMIEKSNRAQKIFNYNINNDIKISDEIAVIKSRTIAEDVVRELWNSNKRNRLYLFGTKVFMPRGQRLRRPLKKIFTLGSWSSEKNQPPEFNEEYSDSIGQRFYRNVIGSLSVHYRRGTNIINIMASSPNAYEAALIANTVADVYKKRDKEWSNDESTNLKSFLETRLINKEKEIYNIEKEIEEYKRNNKIYDIKGNISNLLSNLTSMETNYNSNNLTINIISSQKEYLEKELSGLEKNLVSKLLNSINAQLLALRKEIADKEEELVRNSTIYGAEHEALIKTTQNLKILKQKLEVKTNEMVAAGLSIVDPIEYRQELITKLLNYETELHRLKEKSEQYSLLINKYQNEIELLPGKQSYLGNLEREKQVLTNTYEFIRQKMEEARVSVASEPGKVRIINRAEEPRRPVSPDVSKNLILALIIGALIGFVISISLEYFDNTIRSVEYVENKKLPVLAIIPSIGTNFEKKISTKNRYDNKTIFHGIRDLERRLITHEEPISPISEAYRGLRTSLMYTKKGNKGSLMVSSPGPGEGKTTTIINLAITYANLGKKTILIDADLRKPVIHKVFKGENKIGLTHYLSGTETSLDSIIEPSEIDNLDLIYNGAIPPNPSELLGSATMREMLEKLKVRYDIILFDAPPLLAVTDSVVLSSLTDQFILLVRFGSTTKESIDLSLNALFQINTELTGVVFNDLNQKNSYYSNSYYRYQEYYASSKDIDSI